VYYFISACIVFQHDPAIRFPIFSDKSVLAIGTHVEYSQRWLFTSPDTRFLVRSSVNHRTMGRRTHMADDKMKNDDRNRQAGNKGGEDQGFGQQSPGRNPNDQSTGQRTGSGGGSNEPKHGEGMGGGQSGQQGSKGQSDMGQKR
jgi:hypothetical protein